MPSAKMKSLLLFVVVVEIVYAGPDTAGCTKPSKKPQSQQFKSLSFTNSLSLVFCSDFAQDSGTCSEKLEADEDGLYLEGQYPCQHFNNGEESNEGKPVIAFFSKVMFDGKDYYYHQITDKTGLFLTKDFRTQINTESSKLEDLVKAVVPQLPDVTVTLTCYNGDSDSAIETIDGQEGSVYCKYTVESSDLNRGEGGQLVVRTTTADFAAEDGDEVTMINKSMFLMDKETVEMDCGDGNTFAWFVNGVKKSDTTKTYEFKHDGVDTIIQCIKSVEETKTNTIWNVFTVTEVQEVDPTETDIDVTHEKSTTFNCEIVSETESFPAPLRMWFWLDDTDGAEEELKKVTVVDPPTYEQTITYSDNGNFKCYQENGIGSKSLVKNYKTVYIVDTKIDYLTPNPRYWYEYIESVPEVYYVKKDTFNISCGITKEARYKIWWKLGEEYFHLDETDDVFKKLNPGASDDDKWADSLDIEDTDGWSIIKQDDDASLGHLTKQDFAIENYKSDMADAIEMSDPVVCFLIDTDTMTTVADLKGVETGEKEETFKKLTVRVFDKITKPIVKGPLNQIQSEKIGKPITMNCKTNGIPPSFIYFMFTNNKTEGTNITEELLKEDKAVQFTRYRIERVTDILTTLTITAPNEEDEGKFTCYAINRQTTEDSPEAGPDADVYIEEPCSEGAQFCFKNFSTPIIKYLWTFVLAFGVLKSIL